MIHFTYDEKVKILRGLGYEIIRERVEPDYYDNTHKYVVHKGGVIGVAKDSDYYADNVYFAGVCISEGFDFERLYDQDRVSRVFDLELKKRIIGLFS